MPYRLLMIWKTIGRFQTAARLSASWNAPMFVAPSPSWQRTTPGVSVWSSARAAPTAIGRWPPTMPQPP